MNDISRLLRPTIKASQQRKKFAEGGVPDYDPMTGAQIGADGPGDDLAARPSAVSRGADKFMSRAFGDDIDTYGTGEAPPNGAFDLPRHYGILPAKTDGRRYSYIESLRNPVDALANDIRTMRRAGKGLIESTVSGFTAPGDARSGKLPMFDENGNTSQEAIQRAFDTASTFTGASAAGTAERTAARAPGADVRILGKRLGQAGEDQVPEHIYPQSETGAADATAAAAAEAPGDVGRGVAGSPGGGEGVRAAQLQAERWAGPHQPIEGLPRGAQLVDGELLVPGPVERVHDVARDYMQGRDYPDYPRPEKYHPIDVDHARAIAQAFEDMPHAPNDPQVIAAYDAMIAETLAQYQAIKQSGLKLTPTGTHDYPYTGNPRAVARDVAENNHMAFFKTDEGFGSPTDLTGHPMLRPSGEKIGNHDLLYNDIFRIVHDYFGHIKHGYGFRAAGEDNAFRQHAAMYSPLARRAMTTETRGQNSWLNYGPHGDHNRTALAADTFYAPQKVGLMPEWTMHDRAPSGTTLASDSGKPGAAIAAAEHAKPFYTSAEPALQATARTTGTGAQWANELKRYGAKPEELDWRGVTDLLAQKANQPITRAELESHIGSNTAGITPVDRVAKPWKDLTTDEQYAWMDRHDSLSDHTRNRPEFSTPEQYYNREVANGSVEGAPKWGDYQLPGAEDSYRERLLTLPDRSMVEQQALREEAKRRGYGDMISTWPDREFAKQYREKVTNAWDAGQNIYRGPHFSEPNNIVHRRSTDRVMGATPIDDIEAKVAAAYPDTKLGSMGSGMPGKAVRDRVLTPEEAADWSRANNWRSGFEDKPGTGVKSLHAEEIQSDLHQTGRKEGYRGKPRQGSVEKMPDGEHWQITWDDGTFSGGYATERAARDAQVQRATKGVPDLPFKDSWHKLAMHDMIREAAEKGYDRISWTGGRSQPTNPKNLNQPLTDAELAQAEKGLVEHYDTKLVNTANKIGKAHGVTVQKGSLADEGGMSGSKAMDRMGVPRNEQEAFWDKIKNDYDARENYLKAARDKGHEIYHMDVPQSLKDEALKKGFSLFEDSGAAGKPIAAAAHINTPQFKQWFGDSQVVTKDGTPQTLYHGTPNHEHAAGTLGGFDTFDRLATSKIIKGRTPGMDNVGSWFSDLPTEKGAAMYSGGDNATKGSIYPVHLRVEHPWEPKDFMEFLGKMHEEAGSSLDVARKKGQRLGRVDPEPMREWLQSEGYDGIKFPKGTVDGKEQTVWIALEPSQIKSATGNSGKFDRKNPSILMEDSGAAGKPIAAAANVNAAEARVKAARGATRLTTDEGLAVPGKDYTKASRAALDEIAAGRKGAGPLDLASMNEIPNVPQTAMDRYVPPRGVSERMQDALANKGVVKGVAKSIEAGRAMGADKWYHNEPVRRAFVEELGPEQGAKAFTTYMDMVSATSPRSDVPTNIRNGSFYYQHALEGKPLPEKLPFPYGHVAQKLHGSNYEMLTGPRASNLSAATPEASTAWDIYKNPKPASFSQNLQGNLEPGTIDTHAFRNISMRTGDPRFLETAISDKLKTIDGKVQMPGPDTMAAKYGEVKGDKLVYRPQKLLESGKLTMDEAKNIPTFWATRPNENEYAAAEHLYRKLGKKAGLATADAQAAAWAGAGKLTGLGTSPTHTFAELFNERVLYTSKMRRENPRKTLSDFITGKKPLLSLAGATAVGAMLAGGDDEKPGFAEGGAVGDDYNTPVPDEQAFQQWKAANAPDDSGVDYDLRGAYLANMQRAENGHMGDAFKKPNHPTFSDQSQYAVGDQRARMGYWVGDTFVPPVARRKGGRVRYAEGGEVDDEVPAFDPAKLAATKPAPVFDPKKLAAAKAFDPNDPSTEPSTISEGLQRVWAKPTPGGPVWMAKEAYEGIRNSIDRAKLKGAVQSGAWSPSTEEEAGQLNQIDDRGAVDALRAVQFMSPSAPKGTGGIFAAPFAPRGAAKLVTPEATANRALADEFEIPLTRGQATQDLDQIRYEDMAARGAYGKDLQDRAAGVFDNQYGAIQSGTQRVGQTVARGEQPLGSPVNAGASLNTEVADTASRAAAARDLLTRRAEQAEADQRAQVAAQGRTLDETIGQPGRPLAEPRQAGELANQGVRDAAAQDKAFYQAKYEDVARRPGEFSTDAFEGVGSRIRNDLTFHADPVEITDLTPAARHAVEALDQWSVPSVKNAADPRAPFADTPTSITLKAVDTFARRLSSFYKSTQPGTEDRRAMGRIMGEFGNQVEKAVADGLFSGDPEALAVLGEAKAAFSRYQRTYKPREAGDDVGTAMRRIVERNATPEETANMIVGSGKIGNAGLPVRIADRLQEVLGADSEAWGAIRQAMWQKASQVRSRTGEIDPVASARSIEDFVGSSLAARMFPQQRAAMRAHAQGVRDLDRVIESLPETAASNRAQTVYQEAFSGDHLSGSQRAVFRRMVEGTATPEETAQVMFAAIGGGNPGDAARALSAIQNIVGRDSPVMNTVRQGVWQRLTQEPFGKDQKGQQKMVQAVNEFLNGKGGSVARQLYSEEERKLMGRFADAVRLTIIPKYARTNSDTAPAMLAAVRKYAGAVGAAIGAVFHGGASGGAEGYAVTKAIDFVGSKIGKARQTRKLNDSLEDIIPKPQRRIAPVPPAVIRALPTAPKALVGDSSNPYAP